MFDLTRLVIGVTDGVNAIVAHMGQLVLVAEIW